MTRNDKHCQAIVEHSLRLVCALFTQETRKIVRDTAQIKKKLKILTRSFTQTTQPHATPRTLWALVRLIPSLARKIAGHGVNRFAGKCQATLTLVRKTVYALSRNFGCQ